MNKKYYVFASIIFGLYIPLLIYQFLLGKQHLFLFVFNYFFYVTAMVGAYGLSKEYNPNESMIHAIFKRYKFFYLLSFIPLVILLVLGSTVFSFSNIDIQNCKSSIFPDSCISQIATEKNDYSICEKSYLLDGIKRDNCLGDFAKVTGDIAICDMVDKELYSGVSERDFCLKGIAEEHNIIEACDGLSDATQRNNCYYVLAQDFNNTEACERMVPVEYGWQPHHCKRLSGIFESREKLDFDKLLIGDTKGSTGYYDGSMARNILVLSFEYVGNNTVILNTSNVDFQSDKGYECKCVSITDLTPGSSTANRRIEEFRLKNSYRGAFEFDCSDGKKISRGEDIEGQVGIVLIEEETNNQIEVSGTLIIVPQ